jgi:hypothetical protein
LNIIKIEVTTQKKVIKKRMMGRKVMKLDETDENGEITHTVPFKCIGAAH